MALAYITKIGAIYSELNEDISNIDEMLSFVTGEDEDIFMTTTPCEIETLATNCGLEKAHSIATDGMVYAAFDKLNNATEENFNRYMEFHYSICEAPDVVGASMHGLWIGRKIE